MDENTLSAQLSEQETEIRRNETIDKAIESRLQTIADKYPDDELLKAKLVDARRDLDHAVNKRQKTARAIVERVQKATTGDIDEPTKRKAGTVLDVYENAENLMSEPSIQIRLLRNATPRQAKAVLKEFGIMGEDESLHTFIKRTSSEDKHNHPVQKASVHLLGGSGTLTNLDTNLTKNSQLDDRDKVTASVSINGARYTVDLKIGGRKTTDLMIARDPEAQKLKNQKKSESSEMGTYSPKAKEPLY